MRPRPSLTPSQRSWPEGNEPTLNDDTSQSDRKLTDCLTDRSIYESIVSQTGHDHYPHVMRSYARPASRGWRQGRVVYNEFNARKVDPK